MSDEEGGFGPEEEGGEEQERYGEMGEYGGAEEEEPPPPPLPDEEKELLFLVEFLVDTLTMFPENIDYKGVDPCALQGPVSIALTFLHFPPMVIGELDHDPNKQTGCDFIEFNAGRSLMFALTESQFEEPPPVFLGMTIMKDMPHAFRFPQLMIGKAKIQLSELFKQVFEKYDETPLRTVSKSIKDTFEVMTDEDKVAAEVSLYIRLTCMGENIVTEFQQGDEMGLLFKSKESKKLYECRETELEEGIPGTKVGGLGGGDKANDKGLCQGEDDGGASPDSDDENFEQIFAQINGSTISVKMEKAKRKEKPKPFNVSEFCDCEVPLPSDLVEGMSDMSENLQEEEGTGNGQNRAGSYVATNKLVGRDAANQLVFQTASLNEIVKPGLNGKPNNINYTVKTCQQEDEHGHKKNFYRVMTNENLEGSPSTLPNDPDKDVFILRIIKRSRKDKGVDTIRLEFKTPKEKIVPPKKPPYMVERWAGPDKKPKEKKKKK